MKIICFGSTGLAGRYISKQLLADGHTVVRVGNRSSSFHNSIDIRHDEDVSRFVKQVKPDAIVNCAAYVNADKAEDDPVTAYAVNHLGAWSIARAASFCGARLIHLSTNFVYKDISYGGPMEVRTVDDNRSVFDDLYEGYYARSKANGDWEVIDNWSAPNTSPPVVLRTQSIYGPGGGNYVSKVAGLILEGASPTLDPDRTVSPTSALALARCVSWLFTPAGSKLSGIVHFECDGNTTWANWGRELCRLLGKPDTVREFNPPYRAPRPRVSLGCSKLYGAGYVIPTWQEALAEVARLYLPSDQNFVSPNPSASV